MKLKVSFALTLIALVICASVPAGAQYGYGSKSEASQMWNIRTGVFFTSGSTLNNVEFTAGLEYLLPREAARGGSNGNFSLSADYTSISTSSPTGDKRVTLLPIFLNYKMSSGNSWDYGIGAGIYWAMDDIPDMNITNRVNFAYTASIGYHFDPNWFIEGRYMANKHSSDDRLIGLEIGYRY